MKSAIVFRILKNDQIFAVKQFVNEDRVVIGSGARSSVVLPSGDISPIHCVLEKRGTDFFLCDLGSESGTFKNGEQVVDESIVSGDSFVVGVYTIFFFIGSQISLLHTESVKQEPIKAASIQEKPQAKVVIKKNSTLPSANTTSVLKSSQTPSALGHFHKLTDHLKVGTGSRIEVIVLWQGRITNTYHFSDEGTKVLGIDSDISVPQGSAPNNWPLLDIASRVRVKLSSEMKAEVLHQGELVAVLGAEYLLKQSEACFIQLINGMQLVVRYAPKAPAIVFDSPMVLRTSELTVILTSLIIAILTSLLVSVSKPRQDKNESENTRMAQVIFSSPTRSDEKKITQLAVLEDKKNIQKPQVAPKSGRASEILPKDSKLKVKMFTSVKQGASIKTGAMAGANAQSKEPDILNTGLLAAFGSGGARDNLDKVYSGTGELLGAGGKAKGVSGFDANREGLGLGSKFKDTGAGGMGTATQGISGIGTKGRGTGMGAYGSGTGFGDKDSVQISAGGHGEEFVGSIDKEAVRRVIRSALPQFKSCYEREYRVDTKIEGKVLINWEIHEQGVAKNAHVVKEKSTINNVKIEECVRLRMLSLRFPEPPPGTVADISFPFVFHGQKP